MAITCICPVCGKRWKANNAPITSMRKHLASAHPIAGKKYIAKAGKYCM